MPRFFRKLLSIRNIILKPKADPNEIAEETWAADFSKPKRVRFDIKSESSYNANLQKFGARHCLALGLKKTGCIAWVEAPACRYGDQVINARIRLDARGGYAAGGIMFRMVGEHTYYSFLISTKGYFRLDVLRNGMPLPLIGWTELPDQASQEIASDHAVDFTIIAYGSHIVILIRGQWAADLSDSTIMEGTLCFTAASYEEPRDSALLLVPIPQGAESPYSAEVFLESLTVDSHLAEAAALYEKWTAPAEASPQSRFRLAETFTAMDQHKAALVQIRKAWETPGYKKKQKELLLAGRLAQQLGLSADAEQYISACFEANVDSAEGKEAITEMAKILYGGERFKELKDYCAEAAKVLSADSMLRNLQGHALWNLKEYKAAAAAYDKAFELDKSNGIFAKNAANVYEILERKKEALDRSIAAGRAFLASDNYDDLGALVPKLLSLGEDNWEAHGLVGKWAFGIEDWKMAEKEFEQAEELRKKKRPRTPKDAAVIYLRALLFIREGKRTEALPLLEEAVSLEKDYALFHFKLAENRFLLNDDPEDPQLRSELAAAIALDPGDGWINNFAAQLCLQRGDLENASGYLENAAKALGDVNAIKVNRAVLFALQGSLDKALKLLEFADDPDGAMANCAGNLLVREARYEEADERYRKALSIAPENPEFLSNRASCLIEMGQYGEADTILGRVHEARPSTAVLELISYVASKKGEFARAEAACRAALKMDPHHAQSLLSLGWIFITTGKIEDARASLISLDSLNLSPGLSERREELRTRLDEAVYNKVPCAACERSWKILKEPPSVPSIRLFAMPPDDLPAGSCPECGKAYCIGCAKKNLDPSGRFVCPECGKALKLINEGLKKIVYDWAKAEGMTKGAKPAKRGRPKKDPIPLEMIKTLLPEAALLSGKEPVKRGRGRPRKKPL
ncbi:tetratricopeptide repeat protein [Leadbettera azotonutricia]|uniref:Tetratricopeptide repeat domain protein n=1 Tax=Leadbettera azotonutricia (strain ATCC BAA-888 / DSM 13862 / ZAS-9) TaxID=545695 RepID=F5Y7H3_LEAAZ|nr:tetratricopeptide repeat protein [Leadbettera azotonutricia]AEF82577.1 tetratricopeptide repeat domain protein [Leadbettera azotonutricia ZAS-9]